MTASEQTYLKVQLEVLLKRLKRSLENVGVETLKITCKKGYMELLKNIQQTAQRYLKEIVFCGMGGYFRKEEVSALFEELNGVINEADTQKELKFALFKESDMEKVEEVAQKIKNQVSQVI